MKTAMIFTILSFVLFSNRNYAQHIDPKVVVTNLERKKGVLYIGWYNDAGTFTKADKAIYKKAIPVSDQTTIRVPFDSIPAGRYAISVFLDENGNGMLDKNIFGIPKEKYGFSNNIFPALRAATFDEARFTIQNGEETINIQLK